MGDTGKIQHGGNDDDGKLVRREVQLGDESEEERLEFGELHTKRPTAYIIHTKGGQKIRLIDTPGIGDKDGGVKEDYKNFQNIVNFISRLSELHVICILLRSNDTCIKAQFHYTSMNFSRTCTKMPQR
uniref:AIG1-type G domain-containing protein n=1 Tax=Globodera pallida TaxID=36090 RepID=A0A183C5A1_GLOPA